MSENKTEKKVEKQPEVAEKPQLDVQPSEVEEYKPNLKDGISFKLERDKSANSEYYNYFVNVVKNDKIRGRVNISTKDTNAKQFYDLLDLLFEESGDNVKLLVRTATIAADKERGTKEMEYTEALAYIVDEDGEIISVGVNISGKANKTFLDMLIKSALRG